MKVKFRDDERGDTAAWWPLCLMAYEYGGGGGR